MQFILPTLVEHGAKEPALGVRDLLRPREELIAKFRLGRGMQALASRPGFLLARAVGGDSVTRPGLSSLEMNEGFSPGRAPPQR
jgi:hypothetical protein